MPRTLVELIADSRNYTYIEPSKPREQWGDDEWFFKSISLVINNDDLLKSADIICGWFPPLKLLFKNTLKRYITYCQSMTARQ